MAELSPELSIVLPAWNEEAVIGRLIEELNNEVASRLDAAEIVVVDDCSTDGTAAVVARLAEASERLVVVQLRENRGHGPAVLEGMRCSRGDWIFQLDSDGQFVVADFWKLWERRQEADLVLGVRSSRHDPRHRLLLSRLVATVVSLLLLRRVRDANTPFRLLRRELWEELRPDLPRRALAPSILTVVGAVARGRRVVEVPVAHLPRQRGGSSLQKWRLVRFSLRGLVQLVRFRLSLARTRSGPH
ncbi:MAG: glycosyltransferase family 2 protein [Thermoleophilaceae bacterium]|nr:glycosyltransferase family 2 protein [Thermoleophilaceae bacterium]